MRNAFCLALGICVATGCAGYDAGPVESNSQPIIDGQQDNGDPSMVEMFAVGKNSLAKCTCTLVSPKVLLTAAHCVAETTGAKYFVFTGNDDSVVTSTKMLLPTQAAEFDPQYNDQDPSQGHDLGVIVLAAPVGLPIIPMNRDDLASAKASTVRYVGYGLTDGVGMSGDGVKRQASASTAQLVGDQLIRIPNMAHNTCSGDSGGPILMDTGKGEAVIGVVSFGNSQTCRGDSFFMRLDTQIDWVEQMIQKYDPGFTPPSSGSPSDGGAGGGGSASDGGAAPPVATPDAGAPVVVPPSPDAAPPIYTPPPTPDAAAPQVSVDAGAVAPADAAVTPTGVRSNLVKGGCSCQLGSSGGSGGGGAMGMVLAGVGILLSRRRRR